MTESDGDRYIRERNALIPRAEQIANEKLGPRPRQVSEALKHDAQWNAVFHAAMNDLWSQRRN